MGIAGFFYAWMKFYSQKSKINFNGDVSLNFIPPYKYRSLSIDLPSILHQSAQKIWCYGQFSYKRTISSDFEQLFKLFISEVQTRLLRIIRLFHNKENKLDVLIIASDGRAPVAKMNEQRSRRFISKLRDPTYNFDSAQISPGTDFMIIFDQRIQEWIDQNRSDGIDTDKPLPENVIYSSFRSPGEAEHKIMEYYRLQNDKKSHHVLYGLDNDLILLSLVSPTEGIVIFREDMKVEQISSSSFSIAGGTSEEQSKEFMKKSRNQAVRKGNGMVSYEVNYIDIDKFRQLLIDYGVNPYDYVVIMNLVGNDFLPAQPAFEIKDTNTMKVLIEIYQKVKDEIFNKKEISSRHESILVTEDGRILWKNFLLFLLEIQSKEWGMILENSNKMLRSDKGEGFFGSKEIEAKDYASFRNRWYSIKVFTSTYYKHKKGWKPKSKDEKIESETVQIDPSQIMSEISDMCIEYLKSMNWVLRYYIDGRIDWEFFYQRRYTPLISDICSELNKMKNVENYSFIDNVFPHPQYPLGDYDIITQLVSILPKESFKIILPDPLSFLPTLEPRKGGLSDLFPDVYETDDHKGRAHQVIPIIPNVDVVKTKDVVYKMIQQVFDACQNNPLDENKCQLANIIENYLSSIDETQDFIYTYDLKELNWILPKSIYSEAGKAGEASGMSETGETGETGEKSKADKIKEETNWKYEVEYPSNEKIVLFRYEDPGIVWRLNKTNFISIENGQVDIPFDKLTERNKKEIIDTLVSNIENQQIGFPYSKLFMEDPKKLVKNRTNARYDFFPDMPLRAEIEKSMGFFESKVEKGIRIPKAVLFQDEDYETIDIITNYFTEEARVKAIFTTSTRNYRKNLLDGWRDQARSVASSAFEYAVQKRTNLNTKALNEGIYLAKVPNCTTFKVSVAIALNNIFGAKIVFDPFAGWGDRAIGAIMSDKCQYYIGTDPNSALWKGHSEISRFLKSVYPRKKATFLQLPIEEFEYELYFENEEERPDLIFSGPPYFDYEIYSEEKTQSHIKYNTPQKWQNWLNENTAKAFRYLKPGCYLVYYLGKCGEINIPRDLRKFMREKVTDSDYRGVIPISKETGRPLFCHVWYKMKSGEKRIAS